jgi:amino acid transporter
MVRVLVIATGVIMLIYLLTNLAYLAILGLDGLRRSRAIGADVIEAVAGRRGAVAVALAVCFAALSTLNSTIFIGSRLYQAVGNDLAPLRRLGLGHADGGTPRAAIAAQGLVAMSLVGFGALMRHGFESMVEYTAPVVWLFLTLVGLSLFVLRYRDPERERPFRVPFYPLTPALFCLTCAYLFYASLADTGLGALVGIGVLLAGVPVVWLALPRGGERSG